MDNDSLLRPGERIVPAGEKVNIITDGKGLAWGTDAYLLAAYVRKTQRVCELGAGCGIVSLLCAAHGKAGHVTAIELRGDSADKCRRSVALNGLGDVIDVVCRDIRDVKYTDGDIGGRFGAVFANPPYIAHPGTPNPDEQADDARHENNGGIADFCAAAARLLNFRGSFYCVFRPERLPDLFSAMKANRLEPKRMTLVFPDEGSAPSLVLTEAVLGGGPRLDVSRPLIFFTSDRLRPAREMTDDAAKIYENCDFSQFFARK